MLPLEALSTGLPTITCAAEIFEIPVAEYLQAQNVSRYAGYRNALASFEFENCFTEMRNNISALSSNALDLFNVETTFNLIKEILA